MNQAYTRGKTAALNQLGVRHKVALSDDAAVAALHGLGLTPVAVGADGITAPGRQWLLQPLATTAAAEGMRRYVTPHAGRAGAAVADFLRGTTGSSSAGTGQMIGELVGGGLAAAAGAYGARRIGRYLTNDHADRGAAPSRSGGLYE